MSEMHPGSRYSCCMLQTVGVLVATEGGYLDDKAG